MVILVAACVVLTVHHLLFFQLHILFSELPIVWVTSSGCQTFPQTSFAGLYTSGPLTYKRLEIGELRDLKWLASCDRRFHTGINGRSPFFISELFSVLQPKMWLDWFFSSKMSSVLVAFSHLFSLHTSAAVQPIVLLPIWPELRDLNLIKIFFLRWQNGNSALITHSYGIRVSENGIERLLAQMLP